MAIIMQRWENSWCKHFYIKGYKLFHLFYFERRNRLAWFQVLNCCGWYKNTHIQTSRGRVYSLLVKVIYIHGWRSTRIGGQTSDSSVSGWPFLTGGPPHCSQMYQQPLSIWRLYSSVLISLRDTPAGERHELWKTGSSGRLCMSEQCIRRSHYAQLNCERLQVSVRVCIYCICLCVFLWLHVSLCLSLYLVLFVCGRIKRTVEAIKFQTVLPG